MLSWTRTHLCHLDAVRLPLFIFLPLKAGLLKHENKKLRIKKRFIFKNKFLVKFFYLEIEEISFWSLEMVRDALFKCIIFFLVDLCSIDITCFNFTIDSSTFLSLMSLSIALSWVETLDLTLLFTAFLLSDWRNLFLVIMV